MGHYQAHQRHPFICLLCPPTLQTIPPLLALSQNRSKLKVYIAHLTDLCHDRDPSILSQLTPPSHYHHSDPEDWEEELQKMSVEQVRTKRSLSSDLSSMQPLKKKKTSPSSTFFKLYTFPTVGMGAGGV